MIPKIGLGFLEIGGNQEKHFAALRFLLISARFPKNPKPTWGSHTRISDGTKLGMPLGISDGI